MRVDLDLGLSSYLTHYKKGRSTPFDPIESHLEGWIGQERSTILGNRYTRPFT